MSFYLCTQLGCNKKYKTSDKLVKHLLEIHSVVDPNISEPMIINAQNKRNIESERNRARQNELMEQRRQELLHRQRLELEAKEEAERQFKAEQIELYTKLEQDRVQLELTNVEFERRAKTNIIAHPDDCCICLTEPAVMALVPCGHKNFCQGCVLRLNNNRCPVCRTLVKESLKIY